VLIKRIVTDGQPGWQLLSQGSLCTYCPHNDRCEHVSEERRFCLTYGVPKRGE
jgi:hypothetical protein